MSTPFERTAASLGAAIRRYDLLAPIYGLNAAFGSASSLEAIALAGIRPGERVLEIGIGTGRDLARLCHAAGDDGRVMGVDLSRGMLRQSRRRIEREDEGSRAALARADARLLPFRTGRLDVVFASRVLDLVDTPDLPVVLAECRRVLAPGGRLVLVHMSKPDERTSLFERWYRRAPGVGGWLFVSRPVLAAPLLGPAGFAEVTRRYRPGFPLGSEIVTGRTSA